MLYINRYAFTMIELIFAIVVISISIMSLPVITNVASKAIENNLVQEAIFGASAELMDATVGCWDERSKEDKAFSKFSRVVDIGGNCNDDRLRPGHIPQLYHRRCLNSNSSNNLDATSDDSIFSLNDANHSTRELFTNYTIDARR